MCPGKILPESLMPRRRFNKDSVKSPQVPNTTTVNASPIHTPDVPVPGNFSFQGCTRAGGCILRYNR